MQTHEVPVFLEHMPEGVIASCDELNAVASGATEEEALCNLEEAINALMETYSDEIRQEVQ
ncbi:MAG: hypothetical protein ACK4I8_07300 [Armatimonadota bacterium]